MLMKKKSIILLLVATLFFLLSGCSGGGGGHGSSTPVVTQETPFTKISKLDKYDGLLSALKSESINNPKEFATKVNQEDPLELFLKLKENNSSIHAEDMLHLMKTLEYDIALKPLAESDKISSNALESLKTRDLSIMELKAGPLREWSGTSDSMDDSAQESYVKQQWIAYNNELAAFGKPQLTLDEFKALKAAIKDTPAIFVNFGTAMQNVDINSTNSSSNAPKRYFSPAFKTQDVVVVGKANPVDETSGAQHVLPTHYLNFPPHKYMACQGVASSYPFQVMGKEYVGEVDGSPLLENVDTSKPLLGDEDGKRYFQINETGLAELLLFNQSFEGVNVTLEHNGNTLFNISLNAREKRKVYIPVMDADVCVPYYLTKDDTNIEAVLLNIQKPKVMDYTFDAARGAYDLTHTYNVSNPGDTFVHAGLAEFMLRDIVDGSQRDIRYDIISPKRQYMQYIVQAPSGKLYTQLAIGKGYVEVDAENGKWLVYILPIVPINGSLDKYKIDSTTNTFTSFPVIAEQSDGYGAIESSLSIASSKVGHLKQFVVAEMKNAEFSHDGEDPGLTAEVTLSLHSNMAPKLELGDDLANAFKDDQLYSAYTCWATHGRDVDQFSSNQACSQMQEGMELIYKKYNMDVFGIPSFQSNSYTLSLKTREFKQNMFVWYGQEVNNRLNDERFKLMHETYASIYDEWKNSVVQINDMTYPSDYYYGIIDSIKRPNDGSDPDQTGILITDDFYHPNIPVNMPILAVTKERMATTTAPFSFEYSASDADEVDSGAQLFAVAKYIVNQALAVATSNYAALVCNTVSTMQEMRQNEINGEDDPIGEADFFLNRFSTEDSFYGIGYQKDLEFSISGLPKIPNHYTSYDQNLEYAALACGITGAVVGGYNLYNSLGTLISGDFYSGLALNDLRSDALDGLDENSELYTTINNAFNSIENGTAGPDIFEILKSSTQLDAFANGIDIFKSLSEATSDLGGLGGAGHNVMRSEGNYFFSSFDKRKTRSNVVVKEVGGYPVTNVKVVLDSVHIISNYEDGDAEVKLRTRVGVVSDQTPSYQGEFATNAPYMVDGKLVYENGSNGYKTLPNLPFKGYLLKSKNFNGIEDGDDLPIDKMQIYNADYPTNNNAAAIFAEIGLFEGDGGGVDDDMIGVYSKTFYLEDIYNMVDGQRWTHPHDRVQRLEVFAPVYSAKNLATSVELLDADKRTKQLEHNRERINHPSALIHFTIEVTLGDYVDYDPVDVNTTNVEGNPNNGKEPMDMSRINLQEVSYLNSNKMQLQQVYNNQAVVVDYDHGIRVARIDDQHQLSWRTAINSTNLPNGYNNLLDDVGTFYFKFEPIYRTTFIDDDHLLVFRRSIKDVHPQLVVMGIPENNASVTTIKGDVLPTGAVNMATVRVNGNHLKAFVTVPNLANNNGTIMIYDIGPDSITEVGTYDLLDVPADILAIDDKTLLVKSKKIKHIYFDTSGNEHDEYWTQAVYLDLLELESNKLVPKGRRQYTFKHDSYAEWTGGALPTLAIDSSLRGSMRNVNEGVNNRIVYTAISNIAESKVVVSAWFTNLIYNSDTGSYHFGSIRKTKIKTPLENPEYAYYLDDYLDAYPSDLSIDGRVARNFSKLFPSGKQRGSLSTAKFLDERYLLTLMHVSSTEEGRPSGDELVLIDTLHKDNRPPEVSISPSGSANISQGDTLELNATASDLDEGDEVSLAWMYQKVGINTKYGAGSSTEFSHQFTEAGDYNVSVTATDLHGAKTVASLIVKVATVSVPGNHAPTVRISPNGDQNLTLGDTLILKSIGSDTDGDALTTSWKLKNIAVSEFTAVTNDGGTGFKYTFDNPGTYLVVAEVEDGNWSVGDANITVTINGDNSNPDRTVTLGNLMWEDTPHTRSDSPEDMLDWKGALNYCADLELNGFSNWRLPHAEADGTENEVIGIRKPALDVNGSVYDRDAPGHQVDGNSRTILDPFIAVYQDDGVTTWTDLANPDKVGGGHIFMIFQYDIDNGDAQMDEVKMNVRCVRDTDNSDPKPVFVNASSATVSGEGVEAITLKAVGGDSMTYSISGGDSASFDVATDGVVTFKTKPTNDIYTFTAKADNGSKLTTMDITINVERAKPALSFELTKENPKDDERFGNSVAVEDDVIAVSSYGTYSKEKGDGAVLIYTRTAKGATLVQTITRPDSSSSGVFGKTISMKDGFLAIAQEADAGIDSKVHIYELNSSNEFEFLESIDGENNSTRYQDRENEYAASLAINQNYLVVGTPKQAVDVNDSFKSNAGGAYIYKYSLNDSNFSSEGTFISEKAYGDHLGNSVALMDDLILLGSSYKATQTDGVDNDKGAVVVYKWDGSAFSKVDTIKADTGDNNYIGFARSLAVNGEYIIVGEQDKDIGSYTKAGAVSVFDRISGTDRFEKFRYIANPAPVQNDEFGRSVVIKHPYLIVGDKTKMTALKYSNNDYSKVGDYAMTPIDKYRAHNYDEQAYVGSLAVSGNTVVAGMPQAMSFTKLHTKASDSGRVYLMDLSPTAAYWVNYKREIALSEKETSIEPEFTGKTFTSSLTGADASIFTLGSIYLSAENGFMYDNPADADSNNKYEINIVLNAAGVNYVYPFTWEVQDSLNITQGYNEGMSNSDYDYNRIQVGGFKFYYYPTVVMENSKVYIGQKESSSYSAPNYITIASVDESKKEYVNFVKRIGVDDVTDVNVTSQRFMPDLSYDVKGSLLAVSGACLKDTNTSCYVHLFNDVGDYNQSVLVSSGNTSENESARYVKIDEGRFITQYSLAYNKIELHIYSENQGSYTKIQTIQTQESSQKANMVTADNGYIAVNTYTSDKNVTLYKYNTTSNQYELFQTISLDDDLDVARVTMENGYLLIERHTKYAYDLYTDIYKLNGDSTAFEVVQIIANADVGSTMNVATTSKGWHTGVHVVTNANGTYLFKKFTKILETGDVMYNDSSIGESSYIAIFKLDTQTDKFRFVQSFTKFKGSPYFGASFDIDGNVIMSNSEYLHSFKFSEE